MHGKVLELHEDDEAEQHPEDADDETERQQRLTADAEEAHRVQVGEYEVRLRPCFTRMGALRDR